MPTLAARKHPRVAQRIAELQVKLMPGPEDMRALYQHALAVGLQLTLVGEDDKVRLRAAQWLAGEAEKSGKLEEEARKFRAEDVRKLEEILAARDREAFAPPAQSGAELLADLLRPAEAKVPEPPAPQVRYIEKCVSKPGHHPPRFVRIAVQTPPSSDSA